MLFICILETIRWLSLRTQPSPGAKSAHLLLLKTRKEKSSTPPDQSSGNFLAPQAYKSPNKYYNTISISFCHFNRKFLCSVNAHNQNESQKIVFFPALMHVVCSFRFRFSQIVNILTSKVGNAADCQVWIVVTLAAYLDNIVNFNFWSRLSRKFVKWFYVNPIF